MLLILKYWRVLLASVLLLLSFGAGWKLKPVPPIQVVQSEGTVVERIITVTTKPDGTVIKKVEDKKEEKKEKKVVASVSAPKPVEKPKYTASVYAIPKWDDMQHPGWAIGAGRRIGETNAWVVVEVNNKKEVAVGFRVDF